jgi:hypothetical protein
VAALSSHDKYGRSTDITGTNMSDTVAAIFNASWGSTHTLTVEGVGKGYLLVGQLVYGEGITDGTYITEATETAVVTAQTFGNQTIRVLSIQYGSLRVGDEMSGDGVLAGTKVLSIDEGGGYSEYTQRVDLNSTGWITLTSAVTNSHDSVVFRAVNTGEGTYTMSRVQVDGGRGVSLKAAEPTVKRALNFHLIHSHTRVAQRVCPPGNFCLDGLRNKCPVGTFGNTTGRC